MSVNNTNLHAWLKNQVERLRHFNQANTFELRISDTREVLILVGMRGGKDVGEVVTHRPHNVGTLAEIRKRLAAAQRRQQRLLDLVLDNKRYWP